MPNWFPTPYPDELWYSVICRYYMYSGHTAKLNALNEILPQGKIPVSAHYALRLEELCASMPGKWLTAQDIIQKHTLYPYYSRFLSEERKRKAIEGMLRGTNAAPGVMLGARNQSRRSDAPFWRYCPVCAKQDIEKYGETYWHRLAQISDLRICPIHNVPLNTTGFPVLSNNELTVPIFPVKAAAKCEIATQETEVARLIQGLLESPSDMLFHSARKLLDRPLVEHQLRSPTGRSTDIVRLAGMVQEKLYEATDTGCGTLPNPCSLATLKEMLKRNRNVPPGNVIHVGWALGLRLQDFLAYVDEKDLTENRWEQDVRDLWRQGWTKEMIAQKYALNVDTIEDNLIRMGLHTPIRQKKAKFEEKKAVRRERCRKEMLAVAGKKDVTQQMVKSRSAPHYRTYYWLMKNDKEWVTRLVKSLPVDKRGHGYVRDWARLDEKTYPVVVELIRQQSGRPLQVYPICDEAGIRRTWLKKLPKCEQYINAKIMEQKIGTKPEK